MDAKNSGEDQAGTQSGHQTISVDCNSPSITPRAPAVMAKWIDVYKQQNEKSPGWLGYSPKTPKPKIQQEGRRSKIQVDRQEVTDMYKSYTHVCEYLSIYADLYVYLSIYVRVYM